MDALVLWREAALTKERQVSSRPVSPASDDERMRTRTRSMDTEADDAVLALSGDEQTLSSGDERQRPKRASTTDVSGVVQPFSQKKPSSGSWVRWWSRKRDVENRPELRPAASEPPPSDGIRSETASETSSVRAARLLTRPDASESAPAFVSTPESVTPSPPATPGKEILPEEEMTKPRKKFAKTLRLTSEQLVSGRHIYLSWIVC